MSHFHRLLSKLDVSLAHIKPEKTERFSASVTATTMEAMKGLAIAYGVKDVEIIRACLVIGLEEMLGKAEELGHYGAQKTAD